MEHLMVDIALEPFFTNESLFYVKVLSEGKHEIVAVVVKTSCNRWKAMGSTVIYDSVLMAAFADANLADPAEWTE